MELPPIGELRHLLDRLKSNDIAWFRESFKNGKFAWLKDRLPGDGYETLGKKIEAREIQMVILGILLPSACILLGAGLSSVLSSGYSSSSYFTSL